MLCVVVAWLLVVCCWWCVCEGLRDLLSCVNIDLSVYAADLGRHLSGTFSPISTAASNFSLKLLLVCNSVLQLMFSFNFLIAAKLITVNT